MHRDLRQQRRIPMIPPALRLGSLARLVASSAHRTRPALWQTPLAPLLTSETSPAGFEPDPFVDYGRWLTTEGGILIAWKDLDQRLRHTLWRIVAWSAVTAGDAWLLWQLAGSSGQWISCSGLLVVALVNGWIVGKPVHRYRTIEVRPDGLILDGQDIFWVRHMAAGWPTFQADQEGNQRLCGSYGTRFVEFLIVRRFDELDRTPEVFAAQLQDAMQQLWTRLM